MCFSSSLVTSYYWLFSRIFCSVVTCERGLILLPYYPSPSQSPKSPGTSPLGLTTQNRKNLPIEVTLGGIGSCYASSFLCSLTYYHKYKLCDNTTHSEYLSGTMILASKSFFTSFSITNNNMGLICLSFCLKGLTPCFRGILCSIIVVS
jgi:hypothetical protein